MPKKKRGVADHHPGHREVNFCHRCLHFCNSVNCLTNHGRRIHRLDPVKFDCEICGTPHSCQALLAEHKDLVHVDHDATGRRCTSCGTFARRVDRADICRVCSRPFPVQQVNVAAEL